MPEITSWDEIDTEEKERAKNAKAGGKRGNIRNLKMVPGRSYILRFLGEPVKFHKYWVAGKSAVTANPDTCRIRQKYGIEPSTKYASNIILRQILDENGEAIEDKEFPVGLLYKWEFPSTVTAPINAWRKGRKLKNLPDQPGGDNASDFQISCSLAKNKITQYTVMASEASPLTDEEKKLRDTESYDLVKLYKAVPDDEIEARLFGDGKTPPTKNGGSTAQTTTAAAKAGFTDEKPPF